MEIFPAIDLLGGKAVRLYQGDYEKVDVFGEPASFALQFAQKGAKNLHLVDLDGAKEGRPCNTKAVQAILQENKDILCELGGGIRNEETVDAYINAGIGRIILGTAALKDPAFTRKMIAKYGGERIAVGVDARDGKVATEGWLDTSTTDSFSFCKEMVQIGVQYIIYTDIARDGTGAGANLKAYERLAEIEGLFITASGGVSSIEDIKELRAMGLYAAILGKALYNGTVKLEEALAAAGGI